MILYRRYSISSDVLFSGDNVDWDVKTLDGNGTFHGLGMLASVTPANNSRTRVPRKKISEFSNMVNENRITIKDAAIARIMRPEEAKSTSFVKPEQLPPTENATKYHAFRAYCQVMVWLGHDIDPQNWGWDSDEGWFPILWTRSQLRTLY